MSPDDGYLINVNEHVYSKVPGRVGNWSVSRNVRLARVPVAGDLIVVALGDPDRDGEWTGTVKTVFLHDLNNPDPGYDGTVASARCTPLKTDSPEILDEIDALALRYGWQQHGGPWI